MRFISSQQFKSQKPIGREAAIRKDFTAIIKQVSTDADRTLSFTITTDSVDRHGDTVSATGWKTANFMRNPVVLFAHDYSSLPVGRAISLTPTGHGLRSVVQFAPATANPFAEQVYQLCKGGFLNAASVGFIPLDYVEADRDGYYPMDIKSAELLEWSIVPVPANGEALMGRAAKALGLSVSAFRSRFTRSADSRGAMRSEVAAIRQDLAASLEGLRKALAGAGSSRGQLTAEDIRTICDKAMALAGLPQAPPSAEEIAIAIDALSAVGISESFGDHVNVTATELEQVIQDSLDAVFGVDMARKQNETDLDWAYRTAGGARVQLR